MSSLRVWTIYDHPLDYPSYFVVRGFTVTAGAPVPDGEVQLANTLLEARMLIPPGLHPIDRSPDDDRFIVESWL